MRKIVVISMISLDGVMQAPGGPEEDPSSGFKYGGWTAPFTDDNGSEPKTVRRGHDPGGIYTLREQNFANRRNHGQLQTRWRS
jgi:hypothetical protein